MVSVAVGELAPLLVSVAMMPMPAAVALVPGATASDPALATRELTSVNASALEAPAPGLTAVTRAVVMSCADATSPGSRSTVKRVALDANVARGDPFHSATVAAVNPLPLIVIDVTPAPIVAVDGERFESDSRRRWQRALLLDGAHITPGTPVTIAVDRSGQAALIDGTRPRGATIHDGVDRQAAGKQGVRQRRAAVVGERTNERGEDRVRGDRPQTERGILRRDERHLIQRAGGIDADNRIDWIEKAGRERTGRRGALRDGGVRPAVAGEDRLVRLHDTAGVGDAAGAADVPDDRRPRDQRDA